MLQFLSSVHRTAGKRSASILSSFNGYSKLISRRSTHSINVNSNGPVYQVKREPWVTPLMFLAGFMPVLTFGLGTWQVSRLKWKLGVIDELEEKLQLEPLTLPSVVNLSALPEFVFRKVVVKGRWDHSRTMLLRPRVRDGVHGANVVTPLVRDNGSTVLVDRGFVKNEVAEANTFSRSEGEVQLLGMLRESPPRNAFTPDNDPSKGMWYWTDVEAMAATAGSDVQPVFIEQIFEGHAGDAVMMLKKGEPIGRPPTIDVRNAHLSYIITWYSLSAFTTVMFASMVTKRRRFVSKRLPR